jgi:DMSO/TMAO reductase YedYZ molybdopterin-dependent catalytic subunit
MSLLGSPRTPSDACFIRCHFDVPVQGRTGHRLSLGGLVERPVEMSMDDVRSFGEETVDVVMECAGNGRSVLTPKPPGVPWAFGAVSAMTFYGAPLRAVLDRAGVRPGAVEILFTGLDSGNVETGATITYQRSMPVRTALESGALLAWAMNGEPLTPEHGAPLRLVVPGWYGMASVKWLARIDAIDHAFDGFYQTHHYVVRGGRSSPLASTPLSRMRIRSLIASPLDGQELVCGRETVVSGGAWSGFGPVHDVLVSFDHGATWMPAALTPPRSPFGMTTWQCRWTPRQPGETTIIARATDAAGQAQPLEPDWNELGYGNNSVHQVRIRVTR